MSISMRGEVGHMVLVTGIGVIVVESVRVVIACVAVW